MRWRQNVTVFAILDIGAYDVEGACGGVWQYMEIPKIL